uniref:Putative secreted protein n=1 Tax=Anopheles darlingi TaxID=43151 RepID=A0A2M4D9P7_ANODA
MCERERKRVLRTLIAVLFIIIFPPQHHPNHLWDASGFVNVQITTATSTATSSSIGSEKYKYPWLSATMFAMGNVSRINEESMRRVFFGFGGNSPIQSLSQSWCSHIQVAIGSDWECCRFRIYSLRCDATTMERAAFPGPNFH